MEDFNQLGFFGAIHPEERERVISEWQKALEQKKPYQAIVRIQKANGDYQLYDFQAHPIHHPEHQSFDAPSPIHWLSPLDSPQRLKEVEVSLLEEEEFLKSVLTHLSDGIVACDASGTLILLNRAAQEFHHLPHQPSPSQEWAASYDLYQADGKTPMKMEDVPLYRALNGESVRDMEMHIIPKQGEPRIVLASGDVIVSLDGKKLGAVVAMKDITQRKQAEAALRSLNAELEARVQERTLALEQSYQELKREIEARKEIEQRLLEQNQVLLQQNRELKEQRQRIQQQNIQLSEASLMKSRFLATMSHELRTPMNSIIGFSQLLLRQRKTPLSPQMEEMVKRILNNGKKLLNMVNELLDFSKAEAGKLSLRPQCFDLKILLTTTLEELRSLAVQKHLPLHLDIQLSHPHTINDPGRLRQVIVNLLSNAIKFTEKGYVLISIRESCAIDSPSSDLAEDMKQTIESRSTHNKEHTALYRESDRLIITVEDTGIGIDPKTIDTIFEPFCQLDQTHARKYAGTGLGLAIVDSLLQLMDGHISVESQLEKGTVFRVEIPRWIKDETSQS